MPDHYVTYCGYCGTVIRPGEPRVMTYRRAAAGMCCFDMRITGNGLMHSEPCARFWERHAECAATVPVSWEYSDVRTMQTSGLS